MASEQLTLLAYPIKAQAASGRVAASAVAGPPISQPDVSESLSHPSDATSFILESLESSASEN
ncbi:hypothetical protein GCM10022380_05000 [Amycolatopsis tucumanensis]|uniref:Uncharacterized protein n=1 Tax=Amycolatopsis tucumanensis TaxID=401106 RepID=A0ABP7HGS4_9PSEU